MESKYFLGVPEIDEQHEAIIGMVESLRAMAAESTQQHLIRPKLKELYELSVVHFTLEESFMNTINCPDLVPHREVHNAILDLLDDYLNGSTAVGDYEYLGRLVADKFLDHIVEHDVKMTASVRRFIDDYQLANADSERLLAIRRRAGAE